MGLDAVVFRNIGSLEDSFGYGLFDLDQNTGEAILKDDARLKIPRKEYFAIERRLGNAAEIGCLRDIIATTHIGSDSYMVSRILYSGTHSGDSINVNELPILREEIRVLKEQNKSKLNSFLEVIESLVKCAEAEKNPIVFV